MAKEKPIQDAAEPAPNLADLQALLEVMKAQQEKDRAELLRITTLLGQSTEGNQTAEQKAHREWAQLSAQEKTKLVAAKQYPRQDGDQVFRIKHVDEHGKPTEFFEVALPARSTEEAEGRYRKLMGIKETKGTIIVTPAA